MTITYYVYQWRHIAARIAGTEPSRQGFAQELTRKVRGATGSAVQSIGCTIDEGQVIYRAALSLGYTKEANHHGGA